MAIDSTTGTPTAVGPGRVGLCARCRFAKVARNDRGGEFWRCGRAESEPEFPRYPALPVVECRGFEESA